MFNSACSRMITALFSVLLVCLVCPQLPSQAQVSTTTEASVPNSEPARQYAPFWENKCLVKPNIVSGLGMDFWFVQLSDGVDQDISKVNTWIIDWVAQMAARESFECELMTQPKQMRFAYDLQRPLKLESMHKRFLPEVIEAANSAEYPDDDKIWPQEVMKTLYGQVWGSAQKTFLTADLISIEAVNQGYLFGGKGDHSSSGSFIARLHPAQKLELEDLFCKNTNYVQFLSKHCREKLMSYSDGKAEPQWVKKMTSANANNFRTVFISGPSQHPDTHEQYEGQLVFEFDGYPIWRDKDSTPTLTRRLSVGFEFSKLKPYLKPEIYALLKKAKVGG